MVHRFGKFVASGDQGRYNSEARRLKGPEEVARGAGKGGPHRALAGAAGFRVIAMNDSVRPTKVRWLIAVLACAASWLLYLHRYAWGVVKSDVMTTYDLDAKRVGWIDSTFSITYGIGQIPGGALGDWFGPRIVLGFMILAWSLLVAGLGWVQGTTAISIVFALFGLAQAGAYPVLNQTTRRWFPFSVRTSVQGFVAAFGRFGGACSSLIVAALLMAALGLNWQTALLLLAAPGLLLAAAVFAVFHDSPRVHPWCNDAERELVAEGAPIRVQAAAVLQPTAPALLTLGLMLFYSFVSTFADQLYVAWIPLFLEQGKGLSKTDMGIFAMLPLLGGAAGSIAGGFLNDWLLRRMRPRLARSLVAFSGKGLAGLLIAASVPIEDGRVVMVMLFLCKFFNDLSMPTLWGAITDVAGPASGTVFGIVNSMGTVGSFAAGPVMGWLQFHYGWGGLFYAIAGVYLAGAFTWVFLNCERRLVVDQ